MGHDAGRFLQPPGDSLTCPVCKNVLCDPVTICSDGDVVCSSCSPKSKSCPVDTCSAPSNPPSNRTANITLRTKVNRLLIRCAGRPLGCSWKGPLKDEAAHTKECTFQLSPCPHEACKEKVLLSSLDAHRAECPMRVAPCPNAPGCTFKEPLAKHESHLLTCNRYRCRQQPQGCRFIGTIAALQEHKGFCNATWDELVYFRAQSQNPFVDSTTLARRSPAPPPERQATLPPTPSSSLAEHRREDDNSESSLTSASETSPDVTTSKVMPKHHPGSMLTVTSREEKASISSRSAGEQPAVLPCVINCPASAPSRSSSASLERLLAVHDGGPEGQHQIEAVGVEELQLRVSPWIDSPSPIAQRPAEKRKSSQLKEGDHEKRDTTGSNRPPKKRQRVESDQVTNNGLPEARSNAPVGFTPVGTDPPSSHPLSHPNTKRPYNGNHRGARGRGGFSHRTQDRKYPNGYGPHRHSAPEPQFHAMNPFGYPGPQNLHPHPPANPPVFYNPPYQQGYGGLPQARHLYNPNFSALSPPANQNQNSGTPWQGFEWEALSGPYHPFSRERYSQSLPQVDSLPYPHYPFPINALRDPSRFEVPTRRPDLNHLHEDDIHLDYMDFDVRESNPNPRGLSHNSTNIGTQPQAARPQDKYTTPSTSRGTPKAKSPPSFNRLSTSIGATLPISLKALPVEPGQQPIDRVMVLQRRPDAPRLSNSGPSTTPNNNSLYNRQLDFTPSLLSQPPAEYVLDATFWKIEARDAARKTDSIQAKQTTKNSNAQSGLLAASNQRLGRIRDKGHQENSGPQRTPRLPHGGHPKWSKPTADEKRSCPSKSVTTAVGSGVAIKVSSEKASRSERNLTYGPHSHDPSTRTVGVFPASYGDNASPDGDMLLSSVEVADGLRAMDTKIYESEKWGGGRLIPSGLKMARLKDEGVDLNTTKLSSCRVSHKSLVPSVDVPKRTATNRHQPEGTYKLALPCTGKLLLLDAPPALLPQRSTRSGKVFKPPGGGTSSEPSEGDDSEEETRVNRSRRSRGAARKYILSSEHSDESSSPVVPLANLEGSPTAAHNTVDTPSERSLDGKQDDQEHVRSEITPFTSSASAFPSADRLQPVLTSLDPSTTLMPRHAAKRPPQVNSRRSSRSPSSPPRAKAQHGGPPLHGRGGKQPATTGRGRQSGRGSKQLVRPRTGYRNQSLSTTPTSLTDIESATSPDNDAKPYKQTTPENSAGVGHGPRPISCVRDASSIRPPTLSNSEPAVHVTSPQDSVIPDPTTLVGQLNLTNGHSQLQLSSSGVPNFGIGPLSAAFEPDPYLNGLEDPGSGIKFLGELEQVIDGHFLESLTHGLYGSSTSSCLDSDLVPM